MSENMIDDLTHNNIVKIFGIDITNTKRIPNYNLTQEYEFNVFQQNFS